MGHESIGTSVIKPFVIHRRDKLFVVWINGAGNSEYGISVIYVNFIVVKRLNPFLEFLSKFLIVVHE